MPRSGSPHCSTSISVPSPAPERGTAASEIGEDRRPAVDSRRDRATEVTNRAKFQTIALESTLETIARLQHEDDLDCKMVGVLNDLLRARRADRARRIKRQEEKGAGIEAWGYAA